MDKPKSAKQIKKEKVTTLAEKVGRAKSLTFANYHGLSAVQIASLRAKIKAAGGEFLVEKNTLILKTLTSHQLPVTSDQLIGPTAAILAYEDEITPIKEIAQSNKELGFPTFKFGFLAKSALDAAQLENLANLPSKDQLRAQFVNSLASPIYGIVNVLSANIRNLVYVLSQASKISV